jgi:hypothetical protein
MFFKNPWTLVTSNQFLLPGRALYKLLLWRWNSTLQYSALVTSSLCKRHSVWVQMQFQQLELPPMSLLRHVTWTSSLVRSIHAVALWLRYCATNRKVASSIPDGVIGTFHWHNPSDRTMVLGSTQPLTEMSTRSLPGGKGGRCVGLTTLPSSCAVVKKSGNLNFPWATLGL